MRTYRDHGIVLRTYKLGEADRIVVLLTEHTGKVRAVGKGVRKTRSKFGARLEPLSHIAVQLYQGRGELETITQAESVDHFRALRDDLDRMGRGTAMLELTDHFAQEHEPNPRLYQMLLGALRTLAADNPPIVVSAFMWKVLLAEGLGPVVDQCVSCGAAGPLVAFDPGEGGLLCQSCRRGIGVSAEAVAALQQILGGRLGAALSIVEPAVVGELDRLAAGTAEYHLERPLKSLRVADRYG